MQMRQYRLRWLALRGGNRVRLTDRVQVYHIRVRATRELGVPFQLVAKGFHVYS